MNEIDVARAWIIGHLSAVHSRYKNKNSNSDNIEQYESNVSVHSSYHYHYTQMTFSTLK